MNRQTARERVIADLFGVDEVALDDVSLTVPGKRYEVRDGVVILLEQERVHRDARPVQRSFGKEWQAYGAILPEHREEIARYFDLVDTDALADKRLIDLGCGSGRWSALLADRAREIVLVDFSDAIFVARENLRGHDNCVFFQADITALPFRDDCADLAYSLGVLHHLATPCLDEVRKLARIAPELLVFLYYALDNRPKHWRALLAGVTAARHVLARLDDETLRRRIARAGAVGLYQPLIALGDVADRIAKKGSSVPLWDAYHGMSTRRIEQDVYDRFFTTIEQRVSRADIRELRDTFDEVVISDGLPYWHFLCRREKHVGRRDESEGASRRPSAAVDR